MTLEPLALARGGTLAVVLAVATWTDVRRGIIPNRLNAVGTVVGLALAALGPDLLTPLLAALAAAGALLAVRALGHIVARQPGMGMGDVKLAVPLGLLMGWGALWALYLAAVVGAVVGVAGRAAGHFGRYHRVPFAPSIAAGVVLSVLVPFERVWAAVLALYGV